MRRRRKETRKRRTRKTKRRRKRRSPRNQRKKTQRRAIEIRIDKYEINELFMYLCKYIEVVFRF